MDSPIVAAFIRSAVVPAFVATVLVFVTGFLKDPWRTRLQGLILALGFSAGIYALISRMHFPPTDAAEAFACGALLLAVFIFWNPRPLGQRYLVRGLFVLALGAILLWPLRQAISNPVHHRNLVAFFCLALGVWSIVEKSAGRVRPATLILLPLIAATALSLLMLFSASASFSQSVTVLCACMGGLLLLSLVVPSKLGLSALVPFLSVFVILLMAAGHFYLDINPWHMIYLCFPYLVLWIRELLGFVPRKTVPEAIILGAVSAAPLAYFVYNVGVKAGPLY
ncbi:MAG: hypothetical protein HC883_04775 [Bdellovibrionaceae bacterium]|nr:hypothetical protein [Pseudobdellovibrionaceae bacterium]